MIELKLISIRESKRADKKMVAYFQDRNSDKVYQVHFGQKGASDFTKHKDPVRKERYLMRHESRENWNNPLSAGALSRWLLWNKPTLQASIVDFKKRFNL